MRGLVLVILLVTLASICLTAGNAAPNYQTPCKRSKLAKSIKIDNKTYLLDEIERCPNGRIVLFGRSVKCKESMTRTVRKDGTIVWTSSIRCD